MNSKIVLALCAASAPVVAVAGHLPTVVLGPGTVIGTTTTLPSSTVTVDKFLGIPYAVTPPKRFLPPEHLEHYSNPVNATVFPHICIQAHNNLETAAEASSESEDCLYLNIFTPAGCTGSKAVMFWIHGGDLQSGTGAEPQFDGSSFAANQDVVVVTINYRLNAFGFSNAPSLPLEMRNVGFWDQRMALGWVQDNIAAFGGDPRKVTIFGESSGASSIDRLLTTMLVDPPFRAAITESGQATVSPFPNDGGPAAWAALLAALNCTSANGSAELEFACVQAADARTIRRIINSAGLVFSPVNDNVTQRATPFLAARQAGSVARVPMLSGSNGQEGLLLAVIYGITDFAAVTETVLEDFLYAVTGSTATINEILPIIAELQSVFSWYDLFQVAAQLYTEVVYQCPCKFVTEASLQDGLPIWRYYYNATIPNVQFDGYPTLGAFHSSELSLVWGTYPAVNVTDQQVALSTFMQAAWANFAKDPLAGPGWKAVDGTGNDLACLGCNGSSGVQIIAESLVDSRCSAYAPLYTATTPYF